MHETKNLQIYFTSLLFFCSFVCRVSSWSVWNVTWTCYLFSFSLRFRAEDFITHSDFRARCCLTQHKVALYCTVAEAIRNRQVSTFCSVFGARWIVLWKRHSVTMSALFLPPSASLCPSFHPRWIEMGKGVIPGQEKVLWSGSQVTRIGGKVWWHLVDR